jgi:hypothetical protein
MNMDNESKMTLSSVPMPGSPSGEAHLVLADGTVLSGIGFGHRGTAVGEVVFNTGMTGYQEVLTDPSYEGQLVTFTYPELGNTGVNAMIRRLTLPMLVGSSPGSWHPNSVTGAARILFNLGWMPINWWAFAASIRAPSFAISVIAVR